MKLRELGTLIIIAAIAMAFLGLHEASHAVRDASPVQASVTKTK